VLRKRAGFVHVEVSSDRAFHVKTKKPFLGHKAVETTAVVGQFLADRTIAVYARLWFGQPLVEFVRLKHDGLKHADACYQALYGRLEMLHPAIQQQTNGCFD
jgi:hypothetical protein